MEDTSATKKLLKQVPNPLIKIFKQHVKSIPEVRIDEVMNTDELQMIIKAAELVNSISR